MADLVEEIKGRLGIVDVVSQYVQLKKAGRSYKGLCPFHSEKSPSFVVSPEKQICHCFGCSKGGDIFSFIEEIEGIDFSEALKLLADKAGVKMEKFEKFKKVKKSDKDPFYKAHEMASEFFENALHNTNDGRKVLEYVKKRGVTEATIKKFRLGFAPDEYSALHPLLLKKGVSKNVLIKSGFVSAKNIASDNIYDKYRRRLMFPIFDNVGRICGFGGRALKSDQMPKYLNSPENIIYNKSKVMYGFSHAKKFIKEEGKVVLVEGYFDVLLPSQAGIKNVVATSGTALTAEHAKLLKRFTTDATTCFDADAAGFEATKRAYPLLQAQGIQMKTVSDMKGKDPADFVLEDIDGFKSVLLKAQDFVSVYIDELVKQNDITLIDGRLNVIKTILPYLKNMMSVGKDYYVRELATRMEMDERSLYDEIDRFKLPISHPARKNEEKKAVSEVGKKLSLEELFFSLIFEYPYLFKRAGELVSGNDFSAEMKSVYNELTDQYNLSRSEFDTWNFESDNLTETREKIKVLSLFAEERYGSFGRETLEIEIEKLVVKMKKDCLNGKLRDLEVQITEAERSNEKKKLIELLGAQQELLSNSSKV